MTCENLWIQTRRAEPLSFQFGTGTNYRQSGGVAVPPAHSHSPALFHQIRQPKREETRGFGSAVLGSHNRSIKSSRMVQKMRGRFILALMGRVNSP